MHLLLIYSSQGVLGGTETLILRMSRWLVNQGHQVTLFIELPGQWMELLPKEVRCIALEKRFPELYYYVHARRLWKSLGIPDPDVIKSFDIGTCWIACQLATQIDHHCKVVAGLYGPNMFARHYSTKSLSFWEANKIYVENYVKNIPANNRLFCSVDQVEEYKDIHHGASVLWPIPIGSSEFEPAHRKPKWGKIVSVGRLAPMKEYNLYMIDVIRALRAQGHDVTWTVYGAGEYEVVMRDAIRKHGLEQLISIEGTVPYKRFWRVLEDAYIFVGMGTTILEASLFSVPNITAAAYDRDGLTWGPIYRLPQGSLGTTTDSPPTLKVRDEIERILHLSQSEYSAEQERVYRHVQVHEMNASMSRFMELIQSASPFRQSIPLYFANYPFWFLRRIFKRGNRAEPGQGHRPSVPVLSGT